MREPECEAVRILQELGNVGNQIAKSMKVAPTVVSAWRNGKHAPSEPSKIYLAKRWGVPIAAWTQPPKPSGSPLPVPKSVRRVVDKKLKDARDALEDEDYNGDINSHTSPMFQDYGLDLEEEPNSRNGCLELIKSLRSARKMPGVLASERVKLASAETRALALLSKLDAEAEMSEERIIKHPKWQRMRKAIVDTIVQYPEAARAVLAVLKSIEANDGN